MSSTSLFDFSATDDPAAWRIINDDVMGGVSTSRFEATDEGAAFAGTVSLENGGGFASVRAPEATWDLGDCAGLRLRVRGDGKRYWFTTYTEPGGPVSYRASLEPAGHWTTVDVPFEALTPYRRGTRVPDAPAFDPSRLRGFGFLIADEQAGDFRLEVAWIRARAEPDGS